MPIVQHNPPELFPRYRCYTHATEVRGDSRLLIMSCLLYTSDAADEL